jgi:hypothetical protein
MIYGMNANTSSESLEELLTSGISRLQDEKHQTEKAKLNNLGIHNKTETTNTLISSS